MRTEGDLARVEFVRQWHSDAESGHAIDKLEYALSVIEPRYTKRKIDDAIPGLLSHAELYWALKEGLAAAKKLATLGYVQMDNKPIVLEENR